MNPFLAALILSLRVAQHPRRLARIEEWSLAVVLLRDMGRQFEIWDFSSFLYINIVTDLPQACGI
jgi:hypothetical protein